MARMLYMAGEPAFLPPKAFLAVAAYDKVGAGCTFALYHSALALERAGIASELAIYSGNCHVDDSRNRLVRDFLRSDCTDMVFIDADVGWPPQNMVELLGYDRDVVAGIYPKKHGDDTYPVKLFPGEIWSDRDGLIEVQGVPTGFLRIRRAVLEKLALEAQHYNAKNDAKDGAIPLIFERQVHDGTRWGGDYVFCRKWRALGGKVYIAPHMKFEHAGEHTWAGSVGAWLKQKNGLGFMGGLAAFAEGRETAEHAVELCDAWANPFGVAPELLLALAMIVRTTKGPILECGSGMSTLVMAAAAGEREVHCLENSPVFAEHLRIYATTHGLENIVIHSRPLRRGWYDIGTLPRLDWGMVFVDGPPRKDGERLAVFDRIDCRRAVIVADDVQPDGGVVGMVEQLRRTHAVEVIKGHRDFALAAPKPRLRLAAE